MEDDEEATQEGSGEQGVGDEQDSSDDDEEGTLTTTTTTTTATTTMSAIATVMRMRGEDPDRTTANGTDGEGTLTVMRRGTLIAMTAGP